MTDAPLNTLPERLQRAMGNQLRPDEQLVWVSHGGKKHHGLVGVLGVWFAIEWTFCSVLFLVLSIVAAVHGVTPNGDPRPWTGVCLPMFGIPFVLIGIWMLTMPAQERRRLRNTVNAVTNQRVLVIAVGYRRTSIQSFEPDELTGLFRVDHPDGTGDVILSESVSEDNDGTRHTTQVGFFGLPEAKRVEGLVKELVAKGKPSEPPMSG